MIQNDDLLWHQLDNPELVDELMEEGIYMDDDEYQEKYDSLSPYDKEIIDDYNNENETEVPANGIDPYTARDAWISNGMPDDGMYGYGAEYLKNL